MNWLQKLSLRVRALFQKEKLDARMDDEMRSHIEMQTQENIEEGMKPEEARYAALRQFGRVESIKETCRDQHRVNWVENIVRDVRYGARMLLKNPGFTVVTVLTLTLGIGANTAIFGLIDTVLFKLLPVKNPEQLVLLGSRNANGVSETFSYPAYQHFRDRSRALEGLFAFSILDGLSAGVGGQTELVSGQLVSGNYYSTLGIGAILGRTFADDDDRVPGGHPVAVISHGFWKRRFGQDPSAIGKTISLNGRPFTIIGVTPPAFFGMVIGFSPDVSVPLTMQPDVQGGTSVLNDSGNGWLRIIGRLKPAAPEGQVGSDLDLLFQQHLLGQADAITSQRRQEIVAQRIVLSAAGKGLSELRQRFSRPFIILMGMVGLVLLIACANVANLFLARSMARRGEFAVRLAIGASRGQLIQQLLTESALLATLGGFVGLLFAKCAGPLLVGLLPHGPVPIAIHIGLDARMFWFAVGVSVLAGMLSGLLPALRSTRHDVREALTESAKTMSRSGARSRTGHVLVTAQVAISLCLIVGAGLFVRSLTKLNSLDPGFNRENVLLLTIDPKLVGYDAARLPPLYQELVARIETLPGVRSASLSRYGQLSPGRATTGVSVEGYTPGASEQLLARLNPVGPRFFEVMGIALLRGRPFDAQDGETGLKVAIINESMMRRYFGNENPIGRHIAIGGQTKGPSMEIVGVVGDSKYSTLREQTPQMVYLPYFQSGGNLARMTFAVRTLNRPRELAQAVQKEIWATDPNLPIYEVKTLKQQLDQSLVQERMVAILSMLFGLVALGLATLGLYGLMAYSVAQRTREIGLRMALGAQRVDVLRLILNHGLFLTICGSAAGLVVSFALVRTIRGQLFGIDPLDPITFAGASLLMVGVGFFATFLPAIRAANMQPIVALRCE